MAVDVRQSLRAMIAVERSPLLSALMTMGSIFVPILLRLAIDGGKFGAQFAFIYPAALAIAILCGWRWAMISGVGGMIATRYLLMGVQTLNGSGWQSMTVLAIVAAALLAIVYVGTALRDTVRQLDAAETKVATLNGELLHRSRNALQMIQGLASGAKGSQDPAAFYRALEGRLKAMSDANQLLRYGAEPSCLLHEAISVALEPFDRERVTYTGLDCRIERGSVVPLAMAIHELATNATKYGALSNDTGMVSISCSEDELGTGDGIIIVWRESGGPLVSPPVRRGLGTRLLATQAGLKVLELDFDPAGLRCKLGVMKF